MILWTMGSGKRESGRVRAKQRSGSSRSYKKGGVAASDRHGFILASYSTPPAPSRVLCPETDNSSGPAPLPRNTVLG